jgi:glutaconate CoA-transferase, subunit A
MTEPTSRAFVSVGTLAAGVNDGDRIGIGGALLTRLPLAGLHALAAARRRDLVYVSWGGGIPLEILLGSGSVAKIVFCFSSLDIFGLAPLFRRALEEGTVEVEEWPAFAFTAGLEAAKQHLPFMPFRSPSGSDLMERGLAVLPAPAAGTDVLVDLAPRLDLDVFLVHAQRADEAGNIEITGARGMDATAAFAARRVLATVEEVVPVGTLGSLKGSFVVPRHFVHQIAVVPFGAYPTSCLPYYTADFGGLAEITAVSPPSVPAPPTAELAACLRGAATITHERVRAVVRELRPVTPGQPGAGEPEADEPAPSIDEIMVCWLARRFDDESICSAGAVSPLAVTSYLLAKATHAPRMAILMTSGGLVDIAARPMLLSLGEALDTSSAAVQCGGEDTYRWYYQQGRVTCEVVTAAQVDRRARTNNIEVTSPSGRRVRLPGQGGMADVADLHRDFILYLTRQSKLSLVESVQRTSASRSLVGPAERVRAGLVPGDVALITNLGVFGFDPTNGELVLESLHHGVAIEEVREATGFELRVSRSLRETEPPSVKMLRVLRHEVDPLGIRRLEFAPAKERGRLLHECISAEQDLVTRALHLR